MSRQELADACNQLMVHRHDHDGRGRWVGLTASYIGALERGEIRWPNAEYRAALCVVLNATERDLGFYIDRPEREIWPATRRPSDGPGVADGDGVDLVDLHGALRDEAVGRAQLKSIEVAGRWLDESYVELSAVELAPRIQAQLANVVALLRRPQRVDHRRRLCSVAGRLAGLQAWLMFDLARQHSAARWYAVALGAAREAEDSALVGWLLGARSIIPTQHGDHRRALRLTEQGQAICTPSTDVAVHAWLTAMQARARAGLGDIAGLRRCIERATVLAASSRPEQRRHGMDFYAGSLDVSYYAGISGLLAGQCVAADRSLTRALAVLPPSRPKARAVVTLYLADSAVAQHRLDDAVSLIEQALDGARDQPILPILQHATQTRDRVRTQGLPTRALDERLRDFATGFAQAKTEAVAT